LVNAICIKDKNDLYDVIRFLSTIMVENGVELVFFCGIDNRESILRSHEVDMFLEEAVRRRTLDIMYTVYSKIILESELDSIPLCMLDEDKSFVWLSNGLIEWDVISGLLEEYGIIMSDYVSPPKSFESWVEEKKKRDNDITEMLIDTLKPAPSDRDNKKLIYPQALHVAIQAFDRFWKDANTENMPLQNEIIGWINGNYPDLTENQAKYIDRIIRPDTAKRGGNRPGKG